MLTSIYDMLGLFQAAFNRAPSVATILAIEGTGPSRWAEGTENGLSWRIEAQLVQNTPIEREELQRAYGHMGRHLFLEFHGEVERKVHELGWRGTEAFAQVEETLAPVLHAMDFHMGIAVDNGWLTEKYHSEFSGGVRVEKPAVTVEQVVRWSRLDMPGKWSSVQLMDMFLRMDRIGCYLNARQGEAWVQAHPAEHREVARDVLDASFALYYGEQGGVHCMVLDERKAALAWKRWWTAMPIQCLQKSIAVLGGHGEAKCHAIVGGWYRRAAESKKMALSCLPGMDDIAHGFPSLVWRRFQRSMRNAVQLYPKLVWADRQTQAWLLHKVFSEDRAIPVHPAFKENPAHDFIVLQRALNAGEGLVHEFYPLWANLQKTSIPTLDGESVRELFSVSN